MKTHSCHRHWQSKNWRAFLTLQIQDASRRHFGETLFSLRSSRWPHYPACLLWSLKNLPKTLSFAAQYLFYSHIALTGNIFEHYDVPAAYLRVKTYPKCTIFLRKPARSDGFFTHLGCHFQICNAQEGAADARKIFEQHRYENMKILGWKKLKSEPGSFYNEQNHQYARILCKTDSF